MELTPFILMSTTYFIASSVYILLTMLFMISIDRKVLREMDVDLEIPDFKQGTWIFIGALLMTNFLIFLFDILVIGKGMSTPLCTILNILIISIELSVVTNSKRAGIGACVVFMGLTSQLIIGNML